MGLPLIWKGFPGFMLEMTALRGVLFLRRNTTYAVWFTSKKPSTDMSLHKTLGHQPRLSEK